MKFLYYFVLITALPVELLYFKRKTFYENKKKQNRKIKGKAIIVSNHRSTKDYMLFMFLFFFRRLHCLIAEVLFNKNFLFTHLLHIVGGIKVNRKDYDMSFIGEAEKILNKDKPIVIFPESKLETTDNFLSFSPTYILIALKSNAPIIPIYVDGNYGFFKRAHVTIGEPINLRDYCDNDNPNKEELEKLNSIVRNKILALKGFTTEKIITQKHFVLSPYYFLMDLGRLHVFLSNIVFHVKAMCLTKKKENLKIKGGYIIVANHVSFKDPLILMDLFWRRRIHILTGEIVLDKHKVRNFFLRQGGCVRIDRTKADLDGFTNAVNILKRGGVLVIFPEGKLSRDATLRGFKGGAALMASIAKVPILPLYIEKKKKGKFFQKVYLGKKIVTAKEKEIMSMKDIDNLALDIYQNVKSLGEYANK